MKFLIVTMSFNFRIVKFLTVRMFLESIRPDYHENAITLPLVKVLNLNHLIPDDCLLHFVLSICKTTRNIFVIYLFST